MRIESLEELKVWERAIDLAKMVYEVSGSIKDYGFRDQLQRATVSISNNIAEGFGRQTPKEFIRFLYYARGSSMELRSMLHLERTLDISIPLFSNSSFNCKKKSTR